MVTAYGIHPMIVPINRSNKYSGDAADKVTSEHSKIPVIPTINKYLSFIPFHSVYS